MLAVKAPVNYLDQSPPKESPGGFPMLPTWHLHTPYEKPVPSGTSKAAAFGLGAVSDLLSQAILITVV